ncbi:hypothetical protein [Mycobacterium servetii]|uniref:Uncharacterized protein n=1 Tax=Mycobacterium servetii TaxID=3237418 RepID=A0ABV4BXP4_9MYCO
MQRSSIVSLLSERARMRPDTVVFRDTHRNEVAVGSIPRRTVESAIPVEFAAQTGDDSHAEQEGRRGDTVHTFTVGAADIRDVTSPSHARNAGGVVVTSPGSLPAPTSGEIRRLARLHV